MNIKAFKVFNLFKVAADFRQKFSILKISKFFFETKKKEKIDKKLNFIQIFRKKKMN